MKNLVLCCCLLLTIATTGWCFQESPTQIPARAEDPSPIAISRELTAALLADSTLRDGLELVTTTPDGRRLGSLQGRFSAPFSGDLETAARAFLSDHAAVFNIPSTKTPDLLRVVRQEEGAGGEHISFQMMIDGCTVRDARIELHLDPERRVMLVHGSLPTINTLVNHVILTPEEAIAKAGAVLGVTAMRETALANLRICPQKDTDTGLCSYEVVLPAAEPLGDFHVWLDAETGDELDRSNEMMFAQDGVGSVFVHHPLAGPATDQTLPNLTSNTLRGLYATIENEDGPSAVNAANLHRYDPENTHFDEVNMYFYLSAIHDFFAGLGFHKLDKPLKAIVHFRDKFDNAFFSPSGNYFAFGDGNKLNDLSKEESIAFHEYSHCVMNAIVNVAYKGEAGAMNEGQADYFACSLSGDPVLGEYAVAKMGQPFLRNLENNFQYPEDISNEVHRDGRIWGGVLWDLRCAVGPQIADALIHGGHHYLKSGNPSFFDGYQALLAADRNLNQGLYGIAINAVMRNRGIAPRPLAGILLGKDDLQSMADFNAAHP